MTSRIGLLIVILFLAVGCQAQSATITATQPPATSAATSTATSTATPAAISPAPEFIAIANHFYDLFYVQQDYAGASALFDDQMKAALPESKLKEIWTTLPQQVGTFQNRSDARLAARKDNYQQVIIPMQFEKMAINMLVVVDVNTGKISGLFFQPGQASETDKYRMPTYVDPGKFEERAVTFGAAPWIMSGTLALPTGNGPFPAVVLVHGSGPNDRDETILGNKPFKDIAQGLAMQGLAVLRYDKRTKTYGQEIALLKDLTVKEETIDDAVAAVEFLRSQPQIDPKRIYVVGHSLGGYLVPRIAQADPNIAGAVILASPTRPLEDLMLEQTRYILGTDGALSAEDQANIDRLQEQVNAVKSLTAQTSIDTGVLGAPVAYWLDLKDYDPAAMARGLTLPMLILQGERDYQVTMVDFQNWKNALAGRSNVQLKSYPDLNHLFISGSGKSKPDEYQTPGNVSQAVIQDIAQWIKSQ